MDPVYNFVNTTMFFFLVTKGMSMDPLYNFVNTTMFFSFPYKLCCIQSASCSCITCLQIVCLLRDGFTMDLGHRGQLVIQGFTMDHGHRGQSGSHHIPRLDGYDAWMCCPL